MIGTGLIATPTAKVTTSLTPFPIAVRSSPLPALPRHPNRVTG